MAIRKALVQVSGRIQQLQAGDVLANADQDFIDDPSPRVARSVLGPNASAFVLISGTAYFVYLGRVANDVVPKYVEFFVGIGGSGAQTAEVGLFSSPAGPNKANQTITKLVSTGTVGSLTSTGIKRNTGAFATTVVKGTHLWAGIRTAMATTQPTLLSLWRDFAQGFLLSTAASGALTGAGPWTGAIIAASANAIGPELSVTLD